MVKVLAVLLLGITATVTAFPDNVPATTSTCMEMTPGHGDGPQKSASPYQVATSVTRLKSGGQLEVTIKGSAFKGFYVQARDSEGNPVGSFLSNKLTETHSCFGKKSNAAHHNSRTSKTSMPIFWKAPPNFTGKVTFTATVVKDFATYWTHLKSKPVEIQASNTSYQPFSPGNIFFIDGSKTSGKIKRVKEKRGRIMNRKPTFNSSIVDASSFFQPALATNYQAQVTELYKNRQIDHQLPTSTKFSHIYTKDNPVSSSFSVINPVRPVRNRLSNFEYASPELHHFEQDQPSGLHPLHPYSFDQTPPERKVNYQIHIKPVHQSKKNIERPSKQIIQTSTVCNNVGSSHFLSKVTPLKCTPSVQFRPPKPIFGFRPNFYPFPLESNFLNKRGPFQKSGSFQLPSTPIHASNFHGNFQHSYSTGGIHLPRYGYLIFNPKRGPPYYIIPEEGPFQFGIDNEYLPHLESHQRSVIKPRKFL